MQTKRKSNHCNRKFQDIQIRSTFSLVIGTTKRKTVLMHHLPNFKIGGVNVDLFSFVIRIFVVVVVVSQLCMDFWGEKQKLFQH